jgi:AraC-like DNA-binding protein
MLLHFRFEDPASVPHKVYPVLPEMGFTFYIRGVLVAETPEIDFIEKRPRSVIYGQNLYRQHLQPANEKEYIMITVRFQPGALFRMLRIPMTEFLDKNVDAETVLNREMRETNEKLANAASYEQLIEEIDDFFLSRVQRLKEPTRDPSHRIPLLIMQNPDRFDLEEMASQACLSYSGFERKFVRQMGITPKFFARICRFEKAHNCKQQNPELDWLSVALQTGYHDYQHLVRDFKRFAGVTPPLYFQQDTGGPEKYLGLV